MSNPGSRVTEFLGQLHGQSDEARSTLLNELRDSDKELHDQVLAELDMMRSARDALPTPASAQTSSIKRDEGLVGDVIGGYRVEESIGIGGMGAVYRATRAVPFRQTVAIKVLHPLLSTDSFRRRFAVEQQVLASLDHPTIASILDAGEHKGNPYLVMEFVDGVPAHRHCDAAQTTALQRLRYLELVAHGIQHAHDRGVIHRDIKPSNILVRDVDGEIVVKIIDFGIARLVSQSHGPDSDITMPLGTPTFASPEQRDQSLPAATVQSDVYSLGATLQHLLQLGDIDFRPVSRQDLDAVITQATAEHPKHRYSSAAEFGNELARLQKGIPVSARSIGPVARSARWIRQHPAFTTLCTAVVILSSIAAMAVMQAAFRDVERQAATQAFEETQGYYLGSLLGIAHSREIGSNTRLRDLVESLTRERKSAFSEIGSQDLRAAAKAEMLLGLATLWIDLEDPRTAVQLLAESEHTSRLAGIYNGDLRLDIQMRRIDAAMRLPDLDLAISTGQDALQFAIAEYGSESRKASQVGSYLGLAYVDASDWTRARNVLERSLLIDSQLLGQDHIETIRARSNLAFLSMREGNTIQAADIYAQLIDILEETDRSDSVDMYLFKRQLGSLSVGLERFEQAEPLLIDAIAGMTALHGDRHPEVLRAMTRLADVYAGIGRQEDALALYETVRDAATNGDLNWLAGAEAIRSKSQTLTDLGRQDEAIVVLKDGIDVVKDALGDDHSALIGLTGQLAKAYRTTGQHDLAVPLYKAALERSLRFAEGEFTNARVLTNRNNLANALLAAGYHENAAEQFRLIADVVSVSQPDSVLHGWSLRGVGRALSAAGRYEDAEAALLNSVRELGRSQGQDHRRTIRGIESLLANYQDWENAGKMPDSSRVRMQTWIAVFESGESWPSEKIP